LETQKITRFQDIPQCMPWGNYRIDLDWRHLKQWLQNQQDACNSMGYNMVLDPDFQRGHVWTRKQKINWVEFVLGGRQNVAHPAI